MAGSKKVIDRKISYVTTQPLTGRKIKEEMHSGKDAAQRCFFRSGREAGERAIHSRQNFRGHAELEMVLAEEGSQTIRLRRCFRSVSSRPTPWNRNTATLQGN